MQTKLRQLLPFFGKLPRPSMPPKPLKGLQVASSSDLGCPSNHKIRKVMTDLLKHLIHKVDKRQWTDSPESGSARNVLDVSDHASPFAPTAIHIWLDPRPANDFLLRRGSEKR